ncbi:MAG: tetratricopeptide repeat protein [Peptococcaceae bacterium]|jgi:tetratricopeptide (TPR) repeat protein|nr:tetratricopeptide repeat protein [Peptococcaceae bacterium]
MYQEIVSRWHRKKELVAHNYYLRRIRSSFKHKFGDAEWAHQEMKALLQESEGKVGALVLAERLIQAQEYDTPLAYLKKQLATAERPKQTAQIQYLIACGELAQGNIATARAAIERAVALDAGRSEFYEVLTDCWLEVGNWRNAVDILRKALLSQPRQQELLYQLGLILAKHNEKEDALRCFQGCCALDRRNPYFWEAQGEIHLQLEDIVPACQCYEKAWTFGAEPEALARVAYCYAQMGQRAKGIKYYKRVLKYEPDHYDTLCNLAAVYQNQDRSQEAWELLERAAELQANDPILLNNMAYTLGELGRLRKSIEYYLRALSLRPDHPMILYNYSVCLVKKGDWNEAITILRRLLALDRDHVDGWTLLGNIYDELTNYDTAVDCYNQSLKLA